MNSLDVLSDELLAKIKGIQIKARHLVSDSFAGEYLSTFKGRGMEFEEVREYIPGDDIRKIDWNVTARTGHAYVKIFKDERELTVIFVVDVSASSNFGTKDKFKNEVAAELTALLAYTALRNNDKIGLVIFSDHVEHYLPPRKGRGHVWRLIRDILTYNSESKRTKIIVPLEFLNKIIKKKAIVFLISDFQDEGFERELRVLSKRHDLTAISIRDEREFLIPSIGLIELEDSETGESLLLDSSHKSFQKNFKKRVKENHGKLKKFFAQAGIKFLEISTQTSYIESLIHYFRSRKQSR